MVPQDQSTVHNCLLFLCLKSNQNIRSLESVLPFTFNSTHDLSTEKKILPILTHIRTKKKERKRKKEKSTKFITVQCARHSIIVKAVKATRKRCELGLSSQDSAGSYSVLFASIGRRACAHCGAAATGGDGLQSFCLSLCLTTTRLYLLPPLLPKQPLLLPRESESGTRPTQSGRPTSPSQSAQPLLL